MAGIKIKRGDVRAEVEERYLGVFLADGWEKSKDEVEGDLESKVVALESKDEVEALIKELFGVDLDKRGSLETVREKAIEIIRASKPE